jgi:hypothetical protein
MFECLNGVVTTEAQSRDRLLERTGLNFRGPYLGSPSQEIAEHNFLDLVRQRRESIMAAVIKDVRETIRPFGIELIDVRILSKLVLGDCVRPTRVWRREVREPIESFRALL